jgi:putative ABC transport system permease protein
MRVVITLQMAMKAMTGNKTRTALTMLGMIIGVAAVITMVALGRGAQSAIEEQVRSAGTNIVTVFAGSRNLGGVSQGSGASAALTAQDAAAIRELPDVRFVAAGVNTRAQVIAGSLNWSTRIEGTDVDLPSIRSWPALSGSFFTEQDVQTASNVAVIGTVVSDQLFGAGADPTGQVIRVRNQPFRIIGVMASKGAGANGQDQDDVIFAPYTTVQKKLMGMTNVQNINVSAASAASVDAVAEAVLLRFYPARKAAALNPIEALRYE